MRAAVTQAAWRDAATTGPVAGAAFGKAGELFVLAGGCGFRNGQLWERRPDGSRPGKTYFDDIEVFRQDGTKLIPAGHKTLPSPRAYAACGSAGSKLFVLGGEAADGKPMDSVCVIRADGSVTPAAWSLPTPLKLVGFCPLADGRLAIGGGDTGSGNVKNVILCDLRSGAITTLPEFPGSARILPLVIETRRGLLVAGGRFEGAGRLDILNDAWLYDWSKQAWEEAFLPRPMMAPCAARLDNGDWLVFPGDDGAGLHERLDFGRRGGIARAAGDLDAARPLEAIADALLRDHPGFPKETWTWDRALDTWRGPEALPFPAPATSGCAIVSRGVLFLAPGEPGPGRRMEVIALLD